MKKSIKALITASAVAAVAGVGAVSYAAWAAGSASPVGTTGTTATMSLIGFEETTATGFTLIQPYDQDSTKTTVTAAGKSITLPKVVTNGSESYNIKLKANAALGLDTSSKLYVKLATSAPTTVIYSSSAFTTANITAEGSGWYEVSATDATVISNSTETSAYTAYFLLVSSKPADMGKSWSFTVTAEKYTA